MADDAQVVLCVLDKGIALIVAVVSIFGGDTFPWLVLGGGGILLFMWARPEAN